MVDYAFAPEFTWIAVLGGFFCFFTACGIGANDVANSFATTIGSKSLKLWQAVIIAGLMEFLGAMSMGALVTKTVRDGIADASFYKSSPEVLMYGMMCVDLATGIWLMFATKWGLPVSTTHSCVGAVIGMSIAARSSASIVWGKETNNQFPYLTGVAKLISSWIFSPVLSGIVAATLFFISRATVLRAKENAMRNALISFPVMVFVAVTINVYFLLSKGLAREKGEISTWSDGKKIGISFGCGGGCGVIVACLMPLLKSVIISNAEAMSKMDEEDKKSLKLRVEEGSKAITLKEAAKSETEKYEEEMRNADTFGKQLTAQMRPLMNMIHENLFMDVTKEIVKSDDDVVTIHDNCEVFDARAESVFAYAQIFSACCMSFAHGANDVANAIAPFCATFQIYRTGSIPKNSDVPLWILFIGGAGIVTGLAVYGSKIMKVLGMQMTKITASRGLCIELAASIVIIVGSKHGIPLSTTHCAIGATVGVALVDNFASLNWKVLARCIYGWVLTLIFAGVVSGLLVAQGINSPYRHRVGTSY